MGFYADTAAALADSCFHYWSMDEATGATLADSLQGLDLAQANTFYTGNIDNTSVVSPLGRARDIALGGDLSQTNYANYSALKTGAEFDALAPTGDRTTYTPTDWTLRFRINLKTIPAVDWPHIFATNTGTWLQVIIEPVTGKINVYGSGYDYYSTAGLTVGSWVEVTLVHTASSLKIFFDGVLDSTFSAVTWRPYWTSSVQVGGSVSQAMDAILDEMAFWGRSLSDTEVSNIVGQTVVGGAAPSLFPYADTTAALADNCLHYWRMDAAEGNTTIADSIGNYDGAITSFFAGTPADTVVTTPFKEGRKTKLGLNGSDDYATLECDPVAAGLSSTQYYNASFRIRVQAEYIDAFGGFAASLGDRNSDLGSLALFIRDLSGSQPTIKWSRPTNPIEGNIPAAGTWLEVVATSEGDASGCTLRLYVNGAEIGSSSTGANKGGINPYLQKIAFGGESPANAYSFAGVVDEAAFWSRTLSAAEVSELYNSGASNYVLSTVLTIESPLAIPWHTNQIVDYYLATKWNVTGAGYNYPDPLDLLSTASTVKYQVTLTGSNDATTDIVLPISSFTARLRSGRDSYLSVVVPNAAQYSEAIEARSNGEIVLEQVVDGSAAELARVNFQELRLDIGAQAGRTISLSGNKQKTYTNHGAWNYTSHSYYSKSNGKSRARMQANTSIKPADQMTIEGATFVIDTVTLIGSVDRVYMEISE